MLKEPVWKGVALPVRKIHLIQLGVGGVGRTLVQQVLATRDRLRDRRGLRLDYVGLFDRCGYVLGEGPLSDNVLQEIVSAKAGGTSLSEIVHGRGREPSDETALLSFLHRRTADKAIVIDVTAAHGMGEVLLEAISYGCGVVLANKRPLVETFDTFEKLVGSGLVRFEATVGAGLPVVYTSRYLLDTGDDILSMEGCLSGTMGYLCARMEEGIPFSTALVEAMRMGYTEPDPREDLGGIDVARKTPDSGPDVGLEPRAQGRGYRTAISSGLGSIVGTGIHPGGGATGRRLFGARRSGAPTS